MKKKGLVLTLVLAAALLLAACGGAMDSAAPASEPARAPAPTAAPNVVMEAPASADFAMDEAEEIFQFGGAETDYFRFPTLTPSRAGDRRLIYTVTMSLQTHDFLAGQRLLLDTVAEAEGYLISADIRGYDLRRVPTERRAEFRFRIPTEQLEQFIFVVENNYNIWGLQQSMWEETDRYQRQTWGLDDLREQETELLEAIEAAPAGQQAALRESLAEVRRAIRELEAAQAAITSNVIYSTVDVQLFEAFELETSSWEKAAPALIIGLLVVAAVVVVIILVTKKRPVQTEVPE